MAKVSEEVANRLRNAQALGGKQLQLVACGLTEIPEEVFALCDLELIDFSNNKLTMIPERLRDLRKLRRVTLFDNPLERLPDLPGLCIDGATYVRCGPPIKKKQIAGLWFMGDEWPSKGVDWATELMSLPDLQLLGWTNCELTSIPEWVFALDSLEELALLGCGIREVPADILRLGRLKELHLIGDEIDSPPAEVVNRGL